MSQAFHSKTWLRTRHGVDLRLYILPTKVKNLPASARVASLQIHTLTGLDVEPQELPLECKTHAAALRKSALAQMNGWISYYRKQPLEDKVKDLQSKYRCVLTDAADLLVVSELLRVGRLPEAVNMADGLDTIVRDSIPQSVWDYLHERSGW